MTEFLWMLRCIINFFNSFIRLILIDRELNRINNKKIDITSCLEILTLILQLRSKIMIILLWNLNYALKRMKKTVMA